MTNLKRHKDACFTDEKEMAKAHNNSYHDKTEGFTEDCFQVFSKKKTVDFNLPMTIGISAYFYAKLRVLEFMYDVLLEYVSKDDFIFLESNTDSI